MEIIPLGALWQFLFSRASFWLNVWLNTGSLGRVLLGSTVSGWLAFFLVLLRKNRFRLMWLSTFSTGPKLGWNGWKSVGSCSPLFNRKRLEKCYIETRQPYKLKPVAVETVDPGRPRPVALICACCASIIRCHDSLQTSTLLHVLVRCYSWLWFCVVLSLSFTLKTSYLRDSPQAPSERARLYFLLAWFHAIVQERLRYVPLGWSKRYEFSESDLRVACDTLDTWLDSVAQVCDN